MKITGKELYSLLSEYSALVRERKYKKIDYNVWRELSKAASNYEEIEITAEFKVAGPTNITFVYGEYFVSITKEQDEDFYNFIYDECFSATKKATNVAAQAYADYISNKYCTSSSGEWGINCTSGKTNSCINIASTPDNIVIGSKTLRETIQEEVKKNNNTEKENVKMKGFNFDFGKCGDGVRMSPYGLAVRNPKGEWVSYDKNKEEIINVDIFNFDSNNFAYKIPVALSSVQEGDLIVHTGKMVYVTEVAEDEKNICCIDIASGEIKVILPQKSMFGFNFVTKIVTLFDGMNFGEASAENPFGNMWMLALMDGNSNDMMLPMLMMTNGGAASANFNPMMFAMLMDKNRDSNDLLPLMLMMNMNK